MKLVEIRESYEKGELSRDDFFVLMRQQYSYLSELSCLLRGTSVESVVVDDGGVVITSRSDGVKIKCDPMDKGIPPIVALNLHQYEKEDSNMLFRLVDDGMTFLDIGANLGWYGLHMAKRYPSSNVLAFEPIARTFEFLNANIQLNNFPNMRAFSFGLFNKNEERIFYADPEILGAATTSTESFGCGMENLCQVRELDGVMAELNSRADFLKIDVEGAELFVLQGGLKTIRNYRPIIFAEMLRKHAASFDYHPNDIIDLLAEENYSCFYSLNGRLVEFFRMDENTEEKNFFFLHNENHEEKIWAFGIGNYEATGGWRAPLDPPTKGGVYL